MTEPSLSQKHWAHVNALVWLSYSIPIAVMRANPQIAYWPELHFKWLDNAAAIAEDMRQTGDIRCYALHPAWIRCLNCNSYHENTVGYRYPIISQCRKCHLRDINEMAYRNEHTLLESIRLLGYDRMGREKFMHFNSLATQCMRTIAPKLFDDGAGDSGWDSADTPVLAQAKTSEAGQELQALLANLAKSMQAMPSPAQELARGLNKPRAQRATVEDM